jgi:hypothetical protein
MEDNAVASNERNKGSNEGRQREEGTGDDGVVRLQPRCLPKVCREGEGYGLGERLPRLPRLRSSISCPHSGLISGP